MLILSQTGHNPTGPKSCLFYRPGPVRKVPGRKGMPYEEYDKAETYHDGKWLLLTIDSENVLKDVFSLSAFKRKPKIKRT